MSHRFHSTTSSYHPVGATSNASFGRTQLASTQLIGRREFDARMERNRLTHEKQNELSKFHQQNQLIMAVQESDNRVENLRRLRRYQQQNGELLQAYSYESHQREMETRKMLAEQDEQLAAALSHMKNEEFAQDQNKRRICDESEEINELKSMIKAAQLNKARSVQIVERSALEAQQKARERAIEFDMEEDRRIAMKLEQDELERRHLINMQSRKILQGQMAERELRKQLAYEQFLKEKSMVDDIVESIKRDDEAKLKLQLQKQRELQDNIRTYLEERNRWREEEKRKAQEELKKIQEYQKMQEERHKEIMRQKQQKVDLQDRVLEKLTAEMEAKRREEEELQNLLFELYQEEAEAKALAEIKAREEKINRMRREMLEANEYQKAFKAQRAFDQQREEGEFRTRMLAKFAEDKRIESMNQERRRREMIEYKNEVEKIIQERKKLYEQAVEAELADRRKQQQDMEYKLSIVEAERQRLLDEYAKDLKDYLPKGVFKTSSDYEKVFQKKPDPQHAPSKHGIQGAMKFR